MSKSPLVKISEFDFFINTKNINKLLPFVFYLFLIGMIYIANAHYANKVVVKSGKLMTHIKELRSEYISIKKDLMSNSKQTEVFKRLDGTGLKPIGKPPVKIIYGTNQE